VNGVEAVFTADSNFWNCVYVFICVGVSRMHSLILILRDSIQFIHELFFQLEAVFTADYFLNKVLVFPIMKMQIGNPNSCV